MLLILFIVLLINIAIDIIGSILISDWYDEEYKVEGVTQVRIRYQIATLIGSICTGVILYILKLNC